MFSTILVLALLGDVQLVAPRPIILQDSDDPTVVYEGLQVSVASNLTEPGRIRVAYSAEFWRAWRRSSTSPIYSGSLEELSPLLAAETSLRNTTPIESWQISSGGLSPELREHFAGTVSYEVPGFLRQVEYIDVPAGPHVCHLRFLKQANEEESTEPVVHVSVVTHNKPVLFLYSEAWCGPCRELKRQLHEREGSLGFAVEVVLPVDDITSIPTSEWAAGDRRLRLQSADAAALIGEWQESISELSDR